MLRKILALLGAAEVIAGTLLPIAETNNGKLALLVRDGGVGWEGLILVALAILAVALALLGHAKHVLWPALLLLCFATWRFLDWQGNPGGTNMGIPPWAVLGVGALTLVVAGALPWRTRVGSDGATSTV